MREKPLPALALALLSGLFFGEAFSFFPITLTCFVLALLLLEAFFFQSRLLPMRLCCFWALGFLLHQFGAMSHADADLKHYVDQGRHRLIAEVAAPLRHGKKKISLHMKVLAIQPDAGSHSFRPISGRFDLFIWDASVPFEYGDRLEMSLKLRRPNQYQNPGSFLYTDYRERIGWHATASLSNMRQVKKVGEGGNSILKKIYGWREEIRKKILLSVDERTAAILLAVVIGESGYIDDQMRETFVAAGIAHLLAVSGTHLAFVALFVFFCGRTLILRLPEGLLLKCITRKIPSQWAALLTAFAVSFYALLAGGRIGTLRALTMILVYLFSIWLGRSRDIKSSLALAALLILLSQPRALFEISFQLSFLAVLSMMLFLDWWNATSEMPETMHEMTEYAHALRRKLLKGLQLLCLSSFSAAIGTAPLTLYYFHQFSWVGILSNLLLVPIAGWLLIPFALLSAVAALFMPSFPLPQWHAVMWAYFNDFARTLSGFPGAARHFASPPFWIIASFYASLFFLLITQKSRKTVFAMLGIFSMIFLGWGGLHVPPEHLRITFLDVGQGDAALVEFPGGKTLLIDGGDRRAGKYAVAPYLWQRRIRKIDLLIVSHPQFDHIGGLPFILRKFEVDTVLSNGEAPESEIYRAFQVALNETAVKTRRLAQGKSDLKIAGCLIRFLPAFENTIPARNDLNNRSIVFRLHCPQKEAHTISFLFTGDIEVERERQLLENESILQSTVLKVPHHGSRSSSQARFVAAVSPEIALFSVGRKNRYHHPHSKVLKTYEKSGPKPLRTDQVGAVVMETGSGLNVTTFLEGKKRRITWNDTFFRQEWENIRKTFSALSTY